MTVTGELRYPEYSTTSEKVMGPKTIICPTDKKNKYIIFNGGESIDICLNGLNKGIHIKNAVEKNRACSKKCIR